MKRGAAIADKIAAALKRAERGETIISGRGEKIVIARAKGSISFAIVLDDRILKIEMGWVTIRETSEAGIAEYILTQMHEARDSVH